MSYKVVHQGTGLHIASSHDTTVKYCTRSIIDNFLRSLFTEHLDKIERHEDRRIEFKLYISSILKPILQGAEGFIPIHELVGYRKFSKDGMMECKFLGSLSNFNIYMIYEDLKHPDCYSTIINRVKVEMVFNSDNEDEFPFLYKLDYGFIIKNNELIDIGCFV